MRKIGVLYGGSSFQYRTLNEPKFKQYIDNIIYLPTLKENEVNNLDVLVVPSQLPLNLLVESESIINNFAEKGGIVVAFGPQPVKWIPNQNWHFRSTNFWWWLEEGQESGLKIDDINFELFNYIKLEDTIWHQHGYFVPPKGAKSLISKKDEGCIFYIDKVSSKGTWIVTVLDPDYHFGSYFMPATERFLSGFLQWLAFGEI